MSYDTARLAPRALKYDPCVRALSQLRQAVWEASGHLDDGEVRRYVDAVLQEVASDQERQRARGDTP